jgi:hypothetical protein
MLYVWILTYTFYCVDQTGAKACAASDGSLAPSDRIATQIQGEIYASASGCEDAAVKARETKAQVKQWLHDNPPAPGAAGFGNPHITCERHDVKQ